MNFKTKFPLQLFLTFETIPIVYFTAATLPNNYHVTYINFKFFYPINIFFTHELFFGANYLIDLSVVDFEKTKQNWFLHIFKILKQNLLLFTSYFFYHLHIKLTLFAFYNCKNNVIKYNTIENLYPNANWLEREVSEMFGVYFFNKLDTRNLLLEYQTTNYPFLKNFSCEGNFEIYYNIFDNTITQLTTESIEL